MLFVHCQLICASHLVVIICIPIHLFRYALIISHVMIILLLLRNPLNEITLSCIVLELNCQCVVLSVFSAVLQDQYLLH